MIDARFLPMQMQLLVPLSRWLVPRNVAADQISIVGFLLGAAAVPALAWHASGLARIWPGSHLAWRWLCWRQTAWRMGWTGRWRG